MFSLQISVKNSAFDDDKRGEIARILLELVNDIHNAKEPEFLYDINGNKCGKIDWNI